MSAFGERLRREREMRGVSLDDISHSTKIGTRLLRALEDEHFEILPGGIFNKSYVRSYARYLGIDEEEAVADYMAACSQQRPEANVMEQLAAAPVDRLQPPPPASSLGRASFPIIPVLILVVVASGAAGGWQMYREHRHPALPQGSLRSAPPAVIAPAPGPVATLPTNSNASTALQQLNDGRSRATAEAAEPRVAEKAQPKPASKTTEAKKSDAAALIPQAQASTAEPAGETLMASASYPASPFEVMVRAKDRAWVSIKSDGKLMVRGVLKPPETKTIYANDQVVFWTGNAAEVEVLFNGKNVPLSGGQNGQRVLVFNARGLLPAQAGQ